MSAYRVALVLGGGNALGAYQAGIYEALHERGVEPDWVVGTSIGAVNGAIIAGNPPERRLERLNDLWRPAASDADRLDPWSAVPETWRRSAAAFYTLLAGRRGIFAPLGPLGSWWSPDPASGSPALFDTRVLADTLTQLVDFERLQSGAPRFCAVAVDLDTGDEVVFDTDRQRVGPDHIRASAALLTAFPAVQIGERLLVDGGLSANLPLDPVLSASADGPTLCIAADLLPLAGPRPKTLGEVVSRMQDLTFAAQSRRTIERWQGRYGAHVDGPASAASMTLVRLAYSDQAAEVAGKAMDFSPRSVRHRWSAGYRDASIMLDRIDGGDFVVGRPGLNIWRE